MGHEVSLPPSEDLTTEPYADRVTTVRVLTRLFKYYYQYYYYCCYCSSPRLLQGTLGWRLDLKG